MNNIRITTTDPATGKRVSAQGTQAAELWQRLAQATQATQANRLPDWATETLPTLTPQDLRKAIAQ